MTIVVERTRLPIVQGLVTAVLAVMLAFACATPSRASIYDCVEAVAPIEQGAQAAQLAAEFSACGSQLAGGDPVMALAVATMTTLVASGEVPLDAGVCKAMVNGVIGQVLAKALIDSGLASKLGSDIETALQSVLSGAKSLDQIPALQFLEQYLTCGCTIVTAPGEANKIAGEYMSNVQGCADFFSDVGNEFLNWLEDMGNAVVCAVSDCADGTANPPPFCLPGQICQSGQQCGGDDYSWACVDCPINSTGTEPGVCHCGAPWTDQTYGPKLLGCICQKPNIDVPGAGWWDEKCLCPQNEQLKNGKCVACSASESYSPADGTCKPCAIGYRASADHASCVPACGEGAIFDLGAGKCKLCDLNTQAVYTIGSLGSCQSCPYGTSAPPGSTQCTPLDCGNRGYLDASSPHACIFCPSNQIYIPSTIISAPGAGNVGKPAIKIGAHCGCGENQRLEGGSCVCPAYSTTRTAQNSFTCSCPTGAHVDQQTFACVCPAGAKLNPATLGADCLCPPGQRLVGQMCVPLLSVAPPPKGIAEPGHGPGLQPVREDCAALGPGFINNPRNPAACIQCPRGTAPNATRTACAPSPRLAPPPRAPGPQVAPANCAAIGPRYINLPRNPAVCVQCPVGMTPNATRTACVPAPRLAPPGLFPGRRFPAAPGRFIPGGRVLAPQ